MFAKKMKSFPKKVKITRSDLEGPTFELLKNRFKNSVELEFNLEQCYLTMTNKIEWTNPEGDKFHTDLSKQLPLEDLLEIVDKETHMAEPNNYITATRKNFVSNDNEGRMVEKRIVEIQGTFLEKIRNDAFNGNKGENTYEHIKKILDFTKKCMGSIATWDSMVEKFIMKFHHLSDHNDDEDVEEEEDPNETDNAPEIYLKTYDEYEQELNNDEIKGTDEPWSEKG
ncbi:hypothetical protein Tco_1011892, partial [Tanacetum coccineum]